MKGLDKKLGPLKLWQWLLIGGGTGLAFYLYEKKKSEAGVSPEEEEKLLGALSRAGGGGGEGALGSGASLPVPGTEGPKGEAGPAGPNGSQGPEGAAPAAGLERQVEHLEANQLSLEQKLNKPPTSSHNGAAQALPKGESRNSKGEVFRTVTKGNGVFHEYVNRKGPSKFVKIGEIHKKAPPKKRPKPRPVHKKVKAKAITHKGAAHHAKKREPRKR